MQDQEDMQLKEDKSAFQREKSSLLTELEQKQKIEQQLQLQLMEKEGQIKELEKKLETASLENSKFQENVQAIEKEINALQMELKQTKTQKTAMEERLSLQHQENIRHIQENDRRIQEKNLQIKELQRKSGDEEQVGFTQTLRLRSDNSSWNITRKEIVIGEEIGRGASGLVSKGRFHGQTVAVKQIHQFILTQKHVMDEFKREVRIMASVQHPNLVRFIGAVFDQEVENFKATPLLLLELLHTNLRRGYESFDISLGVSVSIFRDVAYGLHYLHEHQVPIIHRDVSAPNVLLEELPGGMWRAKLSDFGSANFLKRSSTLGTGAIVYTAPEMFPREDPTAPVPRPTIKCDVFSYGIVLVEVITKTMPSLENRHELFTQVQLKWRMMYDLIIQCTKPLPQNRPTMIIVLNKLNQIPVARHR